MAPKIIQTLLFTILLITLAPLTHAKEAFNFTTREGEQIKDATFSRRTPEGVSFVTSDGVRKISFEMMPDALQKRFKYDPAETAAYRGRKTKAADLKRQAERDAELARRAKRERDKLLPKLDTTVSGRVLQVLESGVLLHHATAARPGSSFEARQVQVDGPTTLNPRRKKTYRTEVVEVDRPLPMDLGSGTIFLASKSLAASALDGQLVRTLAYPIGRFRYTDKHGADRTVARFTTDEDVALAYAEAELAKAPVAK